MRQVVSVVVSLLFIMIAVPVFAQDEPPAETILELDVWIPAPLIDDTQDPAYQELIEQTTQFTADNGVLVNYRIKAVGTAGGIMSTIRSGSVVAPGALPDLALIRRSDLTSAQALELFQSLETLFSTALLNDLDSSLELGQVVTPEGLELYGLPYFVDLLVTTYNLEPDEFTGGLTFDDVLNNADSFYFPAARANGLNQTFYMQYLAAGGVPPRNGEFTVNANALQTVLEFYESAVTSGIVTPDVLTYASPSAYRTDFMNAMDSQNVAVVSTSEFLSMRGQDSSLQLGIIPTSTGQALPTANGWVWVMVTPDPTQQDLSVRFLNWIMQPDFHSSFSNTLNQLPAQQSALEDSLPDNVDPLFVDELLSQAILPLADNEGGTVARAMQDALIPVINGEQTAEEATQQLVEQFATD